MAGITLAQVAQLETEPLRKGVIMNIIRDVPIMEDLPFENVSSLRSIAVRWSKLPTGGSWRKLNADYASGEDGQTEQVEEALFGFGGKITYDKVLEKISNMIEDPIVLQRKMKIRSLAYDWKDCFVNGDHGVDEDSFEGLKKRVSNLPTRQTVYFAASNAAGLDPTASTANARKFIDQWEIGWHRCNGGQVGAVYCNENFVLGFGQVVRYLQLNANFLDITKDVLGREWVTWKGKRFLDMGTKKDMTTEIITNTETGGDSSANTTSVYFASYDKEQGITGIQLEALKIETPETNPSVSTQKQELIDWWNGIAMFGSYGLVRMRNLKSPASWS